MEPEHVDPEPENHREDFGDMEAIDVPASEVAHCPTCGGDGRSDRIVASIVHPSRQAIAPAPCNECNGTGTYSTRTGPGHRLKPWERSRFGSTVGVGSRDADA